MASNRFLMVPVDSSAARMPRPGATIAAATLFNSLRFISPSSAVFQDILLRRFARRNDQGPWPLVPRIMIGDAAVIARSEATKRSRPRANAGLLRFARNDGP